MVVLIKNVTSCLYPDVNSEYAVCECVLLVNDNSVISLVHLITKDEM